MCVWGWVGGRGGRPIGTIPAWLASHPMFCSKSLECPGTQSSAPWGRHWCHRLDLIAGQVFSFIPALGLGRLPARSLCQAQLGCVCLSCLWQLQACSWEQRASQGRLLQPGAAWALGKPFQTGPTLSQLPLITSSFECDPLTHSFLSPHQPPHSGGLRSSGNHVLRTLEMWDRLAFASCPHFCSFVGQTAQGGGLCSACGRTGVQDSE